MGLPTDSVVKVNVPPPSAFDQESIGLGFCDSMRSPLSESGRLVALSRTSDPVVSHPSTRISGACWRLRAGKGACATDAGLKLLRRAQDKPALRERRKQGIGPTLQKTPFEAQGKQDGAPGLCDGCRSGFWSPVDSTGVPEPDLEGGATRPNARTHLRDFFFFGASSACTEGREGWGTRLQTRISGACWRLRTGKSACATDAGLKLLRRAQDKPAVRERRKQGIGPTLQKTPFEAQGKQDGAPANCRSPAKANCRSLGPRCWPS